MESKRFEDNDVCVILDTRYNIGFKIDEKVKVVKYNEFNYYKMEHTYLCESLTSGRTFYVLESSLFFVSKINFRLPDDLFTI